ncbi:MAG: hypothetical protein M1830_004696 [Pleopsidium flavum]|nr:MAG: hypothetical protein M1830_004696 [Pleopsidium flavum]
MEIDTASKITAPELKAESRGEDRTQSESELPVEDESINHQHGIKLGLVIFTLCLAVFLCGLDQTIIATAIPRITDDFHALDHIGWWTSAYLLTMSTFQLFYGKLYTFFSIKIVYLCAIGVFEVGSLICATAPNSIALIFGRAIAGVGAAGMFSGSVLVLAHSVPLKRRAAFTGLVTGMFGVASIVGPFLGGVLVDRATWRWCFGINLPIGFVTMIVVGFCVRTTTNNSHKNLSVREKVKQFDIPGTITLIPSLVCLLLSLQWGGSIYPWSDGRIVALLVVFGVLLVAFFLLQIFMSGSRTIPLTILRNRSMLFASLFALCVAAAMFVAVTYLPLWFQVVMGASALRSGVMITPLILGFVVFSLIAGILTTKIGYSNPSMIASAILSSVGAGLLTTFGDNISSSRWIGYQALYGFGVGFGLQQPVLVAQTVLSEVDVPLGVSVITLVQVLAGAVFVAAAQSVFQTHLASNVEAVVPGFNPQALFEAGATDALKLFSHQQLPEIIAAYSAAITETFYIVLALSCLSMVGALGTAWTSMKGRNGGSPQAP